MVRLRSTHSDVESISVNSPDDGNSVLPQQSLVFSSVDDHLWGYLSPQSAVLSRIDFWRNSPKYTIGRDSERSQVVLPGLKISGVHCLLEWDGHNSPIGGIVVTDLSSNGTFINGKKIGHHKSRILNDGNEIAFGTPVALSNDNLEDYRFIYRHVVIEASTRGLNSDFQLGTKLGEGAFAAVYKAIHRKTGVWYAVKMISAQKTIRRSKRGVVNTFIMDEMNIMARLTHRNICKMVEIYFEDDGSVNLVLELIHGGDLLKYVLKTRHGVKESQAVDLVYQICDAMAYIHSEGITHRDLKLENILITHEDPPLIKVADFGLAKIVDGLSMLRTICGTPIYLAPEVVIGRSKGYNNLVDSWSVGVIVFSILTRLEPFQINGNVGMLKSYILNRRVQWSILDDPKYRLTQTSILFIRELLESNPHRRMSLTAAMQHKWLAHHDPFHGLTTDLRQSNTNNAGLIVDAHKGPSKILLPAIGTSLRKPTGRGKRRMSVILEPQVEEQEPANPSFRGYTSPGRTTHLPTSVSGIVGNRRSARISGIGKLCRHTGAK